MLQSYDKNLCNAVCSFARATEPTLTAEAMGELSKLVRTVALGQLTDS
jgi:hypothetical protein